MGPPFPFGTLLWDIGFSSPRRPQAVGASTGLAGGVPSTVSADGPGCFRWGWSLFAQELVHTKQQQGVQVPGHGASTRSSLHKEGWMTGEACPHTLASGVGYDKLHMAQGLTGPNAPAVCFSSAQRLKNRDNVIEIARFLASLEKLKAWLSGTPRGSISQRRSQQHHDSGPGPSCHRHPYSHCPCAHRPQRHPGLHSGCR